MTTCIIALLFILAACAFSRPRGPLAQLEDGIHHLRAGWFWLSREAAPAVWTVRGRYNEWLVVVRRGGI